MTHDFAGPPTETDSQTETDPPEGYGGAACVVLDDAELRVQVSLRGAFQPIDGRFHWYGRVDHDPALTEACRAGQEVTLRVGDLSATARLSDVDPWGRFRITGTGRPPFPATTSPAD